MINLYISELKVTPFRADIFIAKSKSAFLAKEAPEVEAILVSIVYKFCVNYMPTWRQPLILQIGSHDFMLITFMFYASIVWRKLKR